MKLNPPPLTLRSKISSRSDFIHDSGFIPTKADLVKKSTHCLGRQMCAFFWQGQKDLKLLRNPSCGARKNRRPLPLPRFFRPRRFVPLAASATGGARKLTRHAPRAFGFISILLKPKQKPPHGWFLFWQRASVNIRIEYRVLNLAQRDRL